MHWPGMWSGIWFGAWFGDGSIVEPPIVVDGIAPQRMALVTVGRMMM